MSDTPAPRQKRGLEHWGSAAAPGKECTVRCGRGNLQAHLVLKWAKGPWYSTAPAADRPEQKNRAYGARNSFCQLTQLLRAGLTCDTPTAFFGIGNRGRDGTFSLSTDRRGACKACLAKATRPPRTGMGLTGIGGGA